MKVLVTGAGGFVGGHVAEQLLATGHGVRLLARPTNVPRRFAERGAEIVVGDLRDAAARADACRGCDGVVHAAALVTEVAVPDADYVRVNVEASEALTRDAARAGVRRFVYVGSTSVHRPNTGRALDADTAIVPDDVYARSKAEAERRVAAVAAETGLECVTVRPSRVYGPRDESLRRVFRAIARGRFLLVGPCDAEVDFVYATEVAAALAAALERGQGVYLVGGPERVTIERFFREVAAAVGRPLPNVRLPLAPAIAASAVIARLWTAFGREPPVAPKRFAFFENGRVVDNERARRDLGYEPVVGIAEGVRETARWYREAGWL
jgi:nucleoside-diphosphate-sugar epimerase